MGISIPRASLDNITEGDEEWDNIIDMEQGDVPNTNYPRDFLTKHFEGADSMLKSVMSKAKMMSEKGEIHGKDLARMTCARVMATSSNLSIATRFQRNT